MRELDVRSVPRPAPPWPAGSVQAAAERVWDVLVVGGGITGAGVMREAARLGLRVLLLERGDFASGTSSRSSKLIHGGLHYLARGEVSLARRASRERQRLLGAGTGLIDPLAFRIGPDTLDALPSWFLRPLVGLYRLGAGTGAGTSSSLEFSDAQVDDARLVLRILREGRQHGGRAFNYVTVDRLLADHHGRTVGARVTDGRTARSATIQARVVVNAAGVWAGDLPSVRAAAPPVRALRGSHLVLPRRRLPLDVAVAALDPETGCPVYALPWGPVTLVGSTAVPHEQLRTVPTMSAGELTRLLSWVRRAFPEQGIGLHDVRCTFAGLRAIVEKPRSQARDVRRASRRHGIVSGPGIVTVAGGKLTTFHDTAIDVMEVVSKQLGLRGPRRRTPVLDDVPAPWPGLPFGMRQARRLLARYGPGAVEAMACSAPDDRRPLPGLGLLPAEIRWTCAAESVRHLDDILLRRTRLGLTEPRGGMAWLSTIERMVRHLLGWSRERWAFEADRYARLWTAQHGVPSLSTASRQRSGTQPPGGRHRRAPKRLEHRPGHQGGPHR